MDNYRNMTKEILIGKEMTIHQYCKKIHEQKSAAMH